MQKATSCQTKYISLPKKDYVEGATEEIKIEQETNIIQKIIKVLPQVVAVFIGIVLIFVVLVVLVPLMQVYMGGWLLSSYEF